MDSIFDHRRGGFFPGDLIKRSIEGGVKTFHPKQHYRRRRGALGGAPIGDFASAPAIATGSSRRSQALHRRENRSMGAVFVTPGAGSVPDRAGRGVIVASRMIRTRVRSLLKRLKEEGTVVADFVLEATDGSYLVKLGG